MNRIEYIPGDLVTTNGVPLGTAKCVVYRVTATDPNKTLKLEDGTVLEGTVCLENIKGTKFGDKGYLMCECRAWVKDIVPLKLSSEILGKNGWKKPKGFESYWLNDIGLLQKGAIWKSAKGNVNMAIILCDIKYVSELQHLLFGLGLDSNIEL